MTELEKIAYAKTFIDKLANGINPLDDSPIPDGDIANNVRLSRCFFYVSDILKQVIEHGGTTPVKPVKEKKKAFWLDRDAMCKLHGAEKPLSVSEIAEQINSLIDPETTKKLSAASIAKWLLQAGILEEVPIGGKHRKTPTPQGRQLGIFTEERTGQYGTYTAVLYSTQAQQFVYDNLDAIVSWKNEKDDPHAEFHSRPWTQEHDDRLKALSEQNASLSAMADTLKRTEQGIKARLQTLGLIP